MVDEKSIAIILWNNNSEAVKMQGEYLKALHIPEGYGVEVVEITDAPFRTAAYEKGCSQTDAKYKIYLDAKSVMVNENILEDMIDVFNKDASIGIIGLIGTEKIPTSGVCVGAKKRVGKAISYQGESFEKGIFDGDYKEVMAVDGFWMATQYDLPWRTDLFHTDMFWDTAQCTEYRNAGYKVVVPKQNDYWCIADWAEQKQYDKASQKIFLDFYSKDIFPLVSVVIPTYNRPEYFREALESVLSQTYINIEIFITDNSHNTKTKELMAPYLKKYSNIMYEHHPNFESADNWYRARNYNNPDAEYVNWLMDDDLFMPDKIASMIDCYEQNDGIALVTSYRKIIGVHGEIIDDPQWKPAFNQSTRAVGESVGREIFFSGQNFIGEPTTVLIKKAFLHNGDLGFSGEEGEYGISDFPTWLACLQHGDLWYIREPLSLFRMHEGQSQRTPQMMLVGAICWGLEIEYAYKNKIYLKNLADFERALFTWMRNVLFVFINLREKRYESDSIDFLKALLSRLVVMK